MAPTGRDLLRLLAGNEEVEIETRRDDASPLHSTIIWIVPVMDGIYVRSYRGERGRWYREAVANPQVAIRAGRRKAAARAEPVRDPAVIDAVSAAYREKYGRGAPEETEAMVEASVLPTTLRLIAE
jgi:hypothetical protein